MKELIIHRPDDWHLHLRDGEMLKAVLPETSAIFGRATIMPNLIPPIITAKEALAYRERILKVLPKEHDFQPIMTLYLTEGTQWEDVKYAYEHGIIRALKLYPAGATTNSASGVKDMAKVYPLLEKMAEYHIPLLVHGEVVDEQVDIFDREAVFIEKVLEPLRKKIPELQVVMEHITTNKAVEYIKAANKNLAATITTHHLVINRNAYLVGGIKPHYYCLPVAKREEHRLALRAAAVSGDKRFFLGTDSAPHLDSKKLQACGCAGMFTASNTMNILAHIFEEEEALDKLEGFTSIYGADFYNLPINQQKIRLVKEDKPIQFPPSIATSDGCVTLFEPQFPIYWHVEKI
ncbi:MAG: dihydroorotase [Alphaproteobacteria bacterium]